MTLESEVKKLEKLFSTEAGLRSQIPKFIENKVFYQHLKSLEDNWPMFKDVLLSIGILLGDALAANHLVKTVPRHDVEGHIIKKKKNKESGSDGTNMIYSNFHNIFRKSRRCFNYS